MLHKCPYCEEEFAEPIAMVTVEATVEVVACVYKGKLDYDTMANDTDIADTVNEQVAAKVDGGDVTWRCSACDHELTPEEAMAMVTGTPEEGE